MSSQATPPSGFVHLVLLTREGEDTFYLEIPTSIVTTLCLRPLKYLRYLGWCILGVSGTLADEKGDGINTSDGELLDKGIYRYLLPSDSNNPLARAVDLEVIKQRSQVPSDSTGTREDFSAKLSERDHCCVWTGLPGIGTHIIPYSRGDQWLQRILANRGAYNNEEIASFTINDIRNGIIAQDTLHRCYFDSRMVVVLKTPNAILDTTDIPDQGHHNVYPGVSPPPNSRYTMQWIVIPDTPHIIFGTFPNNNDATFMDQSLPKPADVLLHYNYGAAVVKQWGKNASILTNRPDIPRPTVPAPDPTGPSRAKHDLNIAIDKWADTTSQQGAGNGRNTSGKAVDSEVQGGWDEDDIILFLWSNSRSRNTLITWRNGGMQLCDRNGMVLGESSGIVVGREREHEGRRSMVVLHNLVNSRVGDTTIGLYEYIEHCSQ